VAKEGWEKLLAAVPRYGKATPYRIPAYSEMMPAPLIGWRPYGTNPPAPRSRENPHAWLVSEREQAFELGPGLQHIAAQVLGALERLDREQPAQGINREKLRGNIFWPKELAGLSGATPHERYVTLLPLALSKTQDDKGRVRWTFFGGSEQGPDRAFWKSFYHAPGRERRPEYAVDFIRRLLGSAYGEEPERLTDLRRAGFRVLPGSGESACRLWRQGPLPRWTAAFLFREEDSVRSVKYLLTFRPFGSLPQAVRRAYLEGRLHLLPFPGSLIFWGSPPFLKLQSEFPQAMQIPLLNVCDRYEAPRGLRILQSGWLHEPRAGQAVSETLRDKLRNTYRRTHRWEKTERHEDDLAVAGDEGRLAHVLFSSEPDDVGLYGKPMARNAQIWTEHYEMLLDGPRAGRDELSRAAKALREGGRFGYRFYYPPMRVGKYELIWHLPLVAFFDPDTRKPRLLDDGPLGYMTANDVHSPKPGAAVTLWPELRRRPEYVATLRGYEEAYGHRDHQIALNAHKLMEVWDFLGRRELPWEFARHIVHMPKEQSLAQWLDQLADWNNPAAYGSLLYHTLQRIITPPSDPAIDLLPQPITFRYTATRAFEVAYWKAIARLATGRFINKENADCVCDPITRKLLTHTQRDLDALGDWLLAYYRKLIARHGMQGKALAGELPFQWQTDFDYPWMDGWLANQRGTARERNLLVVIPGTDRSRAVIMADHYDTAYMEDLYYKARGGKRARLAAAGADDNHSATAALMLAARVFLKLSRAGKLARDVWLVHLTGEEFPSDCMGARHLAQSLVEGALKLHRPGQKPRDLSKVTLEGVFVLDMIAHNRDHDRDVFQISPGDSPQSAWLAYQAHLASRIWNAGADQWNRRPERLHRGQGCRSRDSIRIPGIARHPRLRGEIRPPRDMRSSLFNTDGQIFSDAGIPVVLFMENYDINRVGYHDTHDTMANIDLDYGAAVAAIALESVARAAQAERRDGRAERKTVG
jgi:hypothetical protein